MLVLYSPIAATPAKEPMVIPAIAPSESPGGGAATVVAAVSGGAVVPGTGGAVCPHTTAVKANREKRVKEESVSVPYKVMAA